LRVLITGYSGFAGGHLADHVLAQTDWEVWGTVFGAPPPTERSHPRLHVLPADLLQPPDLEAVMHASRPQMVFHLAGQSSVRDAWRDPWPTFEINVRMQLQLLQAVAGQSEPARMVTVTSNEVYGCGAAAGEALTETAPLAPINPYALSKVAQDMLAQLYGQAHGTEVVRVRPFTHIGPGQSDAFVTASFARQIAQIEAGRREPVVRVGNLSAERDFSDVRDIVAGYVLAATRGRDGEVYNLGSGTAVSMRWVLDWFVDRCRVPVDVVPDPDRMRPVDVPRTLCDASRAHSELGWEPRHALEQTLSDILTYWRARVAAEG